MIYVEGFVLAVPTTNKEAYRKHAAEGAPLFREFGVSRMVENWGDEVPDGKVNDFKGAVKAKPDETVVFSWFEYASKDVRDTATRKMLADPRMKEMGASMPFDGQRLIVGGFQSFIDEGESGGMCYADGYLLAVPAANRRAYHDMAASVVPLFREHGALRVVEAWEDDVPDGKVTDFRRAVLARDDEIVVFSWAEWPSKEARLEGWKRIMEDERARPGDDMPFDGARMIYGGFVPIIDVGQDAEPVERNVA